MYGELAVSVFFFLSGYGLFSRYIEKGTKYLDDFWVKRILKIVLIYSVFICIYVIYYLLIGTFTNFNDIIIFIKSGKLLVSHSWYIIDIIIMYILFWITAKIFKKDYNKILLSMTIESIIFIIICIAMRLAGFWFASVLCLTLGMLYRLKQDKIKKQHTIIMIAILIAAEASRFIVVKMGYHDLQIYPIIIACISFAFIFIELGKVIQFRNPIFKFLGQISLEVYLIHGLFEKIFQNCILNCNLAYGILVLSCSIICAYVINKLCNNAKTLGAVHTHTHTLITLKNKKMKQQELDGWILARAYVC